MVAFSEVECRVVAGKASANASEDMEHALSAATVPLLLNITQDLFRACRLLSEQRIVKPADFTSGDAMTAVNVLDSKMDVGMMHPYRLLSDTKQALDTKRIKLCNFSQIELISIMDRSIAMLVLWLRGEPPQLTILTNVYLAGDISLVKDGILRGFLYLYVYVAHACRRVLLAANAFDNEDFQPHVLNTANKPQTFLQNMDPQVRPFWDSGFNELEYNSGSQSTEAVFNAAMEAAFNNLRRVDGLHRATVGSQSAAADAGKSLDNDYTLANGIISRLRLLDYWRQLMMLKNLTGDPGFDVGSPDDYLSVCEQTVNQLEVIADSIKVIARYNDSKKNDLQDSDFFSDLNDENDISIDPNKISSSHSENDAASSVEHQRLIKCIRQGQSVMGFDYLLNLECMDYPRATFPYMSVQDAYFYVEKTFLHLYYCTRQLHARKHIDSSRLSMDYVLEILQRLTSDGCSQLIDPYAALDSIKIHRGRSHAQARQKPKNETGAEIPPGDDTDDEDEHENDDQSFAKTGSRFRTDTDGSAVSFVRPGHDTNLDITEQRPNILVRSVLVLQCVAIATRFSPSPDEPASWLNSARDTLLAFCFAPCLNERDPFVCNEWSLMPCPRGWKMCVWKFLGIFFDNNNNNNPSSDIAERHDLHAENDLLIKPLIEGASLIIKEKIRICGMNKAVQRDACIRLLGEIAIYEQQAAAVDARFQELLDMLLQKLSSRLVAKPLPTSTSIVQNSPGGGRRQIKPNAQQHQTSAASRPSNDQISTVKRMFDYRQRDTIKSWFSYQLADSVLQAFSLSLELGLYASVVDSPLEALEYVYWYQAQHVIDKKLTSLCEAHAALTANHKVYQNNLQTFISRQPTTNYGKIVALSPSSSVPPPLASTKTGQPQQPQQHKNKSNNKQQSKNAKKNIKSNGAIIEHNTASDQQAAELAVRNEHRVLTTFAQRKLIAATQYAHVGSCFLDRQLVQTKAISRCCAAIAYTLRLLRLLGRVDNDSVIVIDGAATVAETVDKTLSSSTKQIDVDTVDRLDVEEISFYHRLFPYVLTPEMRQQYFCSYGEYENYTTTEAKLHAEMFSFGTEKNAADSADQIAGIKNDAAKNAKFVSFSADEPQKLADFYFTTLPKVFQRIEADLNITASAPSASFSAIDPAVVDVSSTFAGDTGLTSKSLGNNNTAAVLSARTGVVGSDIVRDDIVRLYDEALRQTLSKVCRFNRLALITMASNRAEGLQTRVKLDFTECSVFPVIRLML